MRLLLFLLFIPVVCFSAEKYDVKTYIPEKAPRYIPMVMQETSRIFPLFDDYAYFCSLIEQESCIHLRHKKCWDPSSELKTSRERGAGLAQLTIAYRPDGSVRFDSLKELRDRNTQELKELTWNNITTRPDLQVRGMALMIKASYNKLSLVKDPVERKRMTDAAYNGGDGGISKERMVCGLTEGCDPQIWFGHVEKIKVKSQKPIYGDRSPWMINREHVQMATVTRLPKYKSLCSLPTVSQPP